MEIIGAVFIANVIACFALLWKKAGPRKTAAVVGGVMLASIVVIGCLFHELYPAAYAARSATFQSWLLFGGFASFGGPVIGALLAWYSRRRFAQFRGIAGGKPYGDGI